jgi:hypothetical protein
LVLRTDFAGQNPDTNPDERIIPRSPNEAIVNGKTVRARSPANHVKLAQKHPRRNGRGSRLSRHVDAALLIGAAAPPSEESELRSRDAF